MSRQLIIDIGLKEVGYKETPPNSNRTKYGEWFGLNGVAWCGIFCSWVYSQAKHPLGTVDYIHGIAGVPFALNFYTKKGRLVKSPNVGDLVLFDWDNDKSADHIALFYKWVDVKKGIFLTIEGNTSFGNQSNGGEVMQRERFTHHVEAFIDPLGLPL